MFYRRCLLLAGGVALFALPLAVFAAPTPFNRDLALGSVGEDVRSLQELLNRDLATRLAADGPGSPSKETSYFGFLTKGAVLRFQQQYRREILDPVGRAAADGFVDTRTRQKLNSLLLGTLPVFCPVGYICTPLVPTISPALPSPPPASPTLHLLALSPATGRAGTAVTVSGQGFAATSNTVYTGYSTLTDVPSPDGRTITFTISPDFSDAESDDNPFFGAPEILLPAPISPLPPTVLLPAPATLPLSIYVENQTGISNELIFQLEL